MNILCLIYFILEIFDIFCWNCVADQTQNHRARIGITITCNLKLTIVNFLEQILFVFHPATMTT